MIVERDRKLLNDWFRADVGGLTPKDVERLDALSAAALTFAKAVFENIPCGLKREFILSDIRVAYITAIEQVRDGAPR